MTTNITLAKTVLPDVFEVLVEPELDLSVQDALDGLAEYKFDKFYDRYYDLRGEVISIAAMLGTNLQHSGWTKWMDSKDASSNAIYDWHIDGVAHKGGVAQWDINGSLRAIVAAEGQVATEYQQNGIVFQTEIGRLYLVRRGISHKAPMSMIGHPRMLFRIDGTYRAFEDGEKVI